MVNSLHLLERYRLKLKFDSLYRLIEVALVISLRTPGLSLLSFAKCSLFLLLFEAELAFVLGLIHCLRISVPGIVLGVMCAWSLTCKGTCCVRRMTLERFWKSSSLGQPSTVCQVYQAEISRFWPLPCYGCMFPDFIQGFSSSLSFWRY